MNDKTQPRSDKLYHVGCDVVNCRYHGPDNHCHADSITVESTSATRMSETFCGTFSAKLKF
ncbi:MAG: DUF1540 domain-containing protein [Oscillospiraceae bacterium]|nr:DUF1540 domain-containing protein [Oscillospiraceae bacterium]